MSTNLQLSVLIRLIAQTRENIDRYCEKFEKDMLHLFDRAYRRGDPKMMHVCTVDVSNDLQLIARIALCTNTARLQWWGLVRASICEPARFLHKSRARGHQH